MFSVDVNHQYASFCECSPHVKVPTGLCGSVQVQGGRRKVPEKVRDADSSESLSQFSVNVNSSQVRSSLVVKYFKILPRIL